MVGSLKKGSGVMGLTWVGNNIPPSKAGPGKEQGVCHTILVPLLVAFSLGILGGQPLLLHFPPGLDSVTPQRKMIYA